MKKKNKDLKPLKKNSIERIKNAVAEDALEKVDTNAEEEAIYVMSESEGWRIMMKKANKLICELLEPIDSKEITDRANLVTIGANSLGNGKALRVLREFINEAESIKNARRLEKQKEQKKEDDQGEESKPEA